MFPPLNRLRLQNIFNPDLNSESEMPPTPAIGSNYNPPQLGPLTMGPIPQPMEQDYDPGARMKELYTPDNTASDRFNSMIDNPPVYNEHQGKLRSLAAAIIAATQGAKAGTAALMAPYNHQVAEYKQRIGPAQQAATLEKGNNANERTLAYQTVNQELANRRDDARNKTNEENTRIRADRAEVYRYKTEHPNVKFDFSGPTVKIADPATGQVSDTGIKTGSLSDSDKLELQQKNALTRIHETGNENRRTEETRQEGRTDLAETRGWKVYNVPDPDKPGQTKAIKINEITGDVMDLNKPGMGAVSTPSGNSSSSSTRGEQPTQTRVRNFNKALEVFNTRPDLRPFLKMGSPGSNDFQITGSSSFRQAGRDADAAKIAELNNLIYGSEGTPSNSNMGGGRGGGPGRSNMPQPRFSDTNPPPAPQGYRYVRKSGGGWTAIPSGGR